jgi:nitrogen regulatory protein PII
MKNIQEDARQIVCIVPKGKASSINKGLIEDHGIHSATFHHARGSSKASLSAKGLGQQREKDVLQVSVRKEIADEIFEYIFFKAGLNQAHSGIVYMTKVPWATIMS